MVTLGVAEAAAAVVTAVGVPVEVAPLLSSGWQATSASSALAAAATLTAQVGRVKERADMTHLPRPVPHQRGRPRSRARAASCTAPSLCEPLGEADMPDEAHDKWLRRT